MASVDKSVVESQLKGLTAAIDAIPTSESTAPRPTIGRTDARSFAQNFGTDATLDHVNAMLSLDPYGAEAFLLAANELLESHKSEKCELDISDSQGKQDFGALFEFVLSGLVAMEKNDRSLYLWRYPCAI